MSLTGLSKNEGVSGFKVVCEKLKVLNFHEFSRSCQSVKVKYAVKVAITNIYHLLQ